MNVATAVDDPYEPADTAVSYRENVVVVPAPLTASICPAVPVALESLLLNET